MTTSNESTPVGAPGAACEECGMTAPRHSLRCSRSAPAAAASSPPASSDTAPPPPRRRSERVAPPTGKSIGAVTDALRKLIAQARSDYFTFVAAVVGLTLALVVGSTIVIRWSGGELAPRTGAVVVVAVAIVFGAFAAKLARDTVRGLICLGAAVLLAATIVAVAFYTDFASHSPKAFWLLLGTIFFLVFPVLGLARRQGEAAYGDDLDAVMAKAGKSLETSMQSMPSRRLSFWQFTLGYSPYSVRMAQVRAMKRDVRAAAQATQAIGAAGSIAVLAIFTAWADIVASSWIALDEPDAATPATLLAAFTGGVEGFEKQLAALSEDRREAALRMLFHLKLLMRLQDGTLRLTAKGEKVVV